MKPLLVFPDPAPPELAQALDLGGYAWVGVADSTAAEANMPASGWGGAVVVAATAAEQAFAICRAIRRGEDAVEPVVILVTGAQLAGLESRTELFDDFCLWPFQPRELEARLKSALARAGHDASANHIVEYEALRLNVETYQATIDGRAMDLTYMEYELLKFLASNPGKVFTRETLLSRVWGYDYFGGARTVDVHVRRLRAKLGDDHSGLITTIRSVGYSFGESRWG